jgi:hypothetical protein
MAITSKREAARVLRIEAENIRKHGLDDVHTYTYDCIQAQIQTDRCAFCMLREFTPESERDQEYPCQHIEPEKYAQIISTPGMAQKLVTRFDDLANTLELAAAKEESAR